MGGGRWDDDFYTSSASSRKTSGVDDFAFSKSTTKVHDDLSPLRINDKVTGKLESRDSKEHPNSNAVLVSFDVTGSNYTRAVDAQKALPNLMTLLTKYLSDPQVAIAANDDFKVEPDACVQISEFESDNRIDDHIRNIWLVNDGGANDGESYDLILYAAARKTSLDCFEKRGRKGYLFLYADEPFMTFVDKSEVKYVFGDKIQKHIPIEDMIEEVRKMYHVFLLFPNGGYEHAYRQFVDLFGEEYIVRVQHPNKICEVIGVTIGLNEEKITPADAITDLVAVGMSKTAATDITKSLVPLSRNWAVAKTTGGLPKVGTTRTGASRL
jgi:hypothetical protein